MNNPTELVERANADTVAFVQEWLANADYDPTQFDKDFAAAIDARCAATITRLTAENGRLREAMVDLLSWFESGPTSFGPWIIKAGPYGVDDAVVAARASLEPQP